MLDYSYIITNFSWKCCSFGIKKLHIDEDKDVLEIDFLFWTILFVKEY